MDIIVELCRGKRAGVEGDWVNLVVGDNREDSTQSVVGGVCSRSLPLADRPRLRLPLRDCGRVGAPVDEDRLVPAEGPGAGAGVGVIARATD